jgi:hypothetical protein
MRDGEHYNSQLGMIIEITFEVISKQPARNTSGNAVDALRYEIRRLN